MHHIQRCMDSKLLHIEFSGRNRAKNVLNRLYFDKKVKSYLILTYVKIAYKMIYKDIQII